MSEYVVLKLVTGEQLVATLINETSNEVLVLNPVVIRTVQGFANGKLIEQTVTNSYCQLAATKDFLFERKNLIFAKPLHADIIPFYIRLMKIMTKEDKNIKSYYDSTNVEEPEESDELEDQPEDNSLKIH